MVDPEPLIVEYSLVNWGDTSTKPGDKNYRTRRATIPGDMFGAGQERFVRLAFANVTDDKIPTVLERLERFGA